MPVIEIQGLKGLKGLSLELRATWRLQNAAKLKGKSANFEDRLYANQQFVSKYGEDLFHLLNKDQRDELFKLDIVQELFDNIYSDNDNYSALNNLTTEGKIALFERGYTPQSEIDKDYNEEMSPEKVRERAKGALQALAWAPATSLSQTSNVYGSIMNAPLELKKKREKDNEDLFNTIKAEDDRRKADSVAGDVNTIVSNWQNAIDNNLQIDNKSAVQWINDNFEKIAGGSEETTNEGFGDRISITPGSRYYRAFKNSKELEGLTMLDKMKFLAEYFAIANKYGEGDSQGVLETKMQDYVSDALNGWDWAGNTLKNVVVGGTANLMNKALGLAAIGVELTYGRKGLANYLEGKDAATGEYNGRWNNPKYWEGVDLFNTWDWDEIKRAEENGGISLYQNITRAGEEMSGWATVNEALKMTKFLWSDYLMGRLMGAGLRGLTKVTGGQFAASGELAPSASAASRFINKAGAIGTVAMSGVGISESYGMQTYNLTLLEANLQLDQLIDKEAAEYANNIISSDEGKIRIEDYVKRQVELLKKLKAQLAKTLERIYDIPIDEEAIRRQAIALYTETLTLLYKENNPHTEDREAARRMAADAYMVDATIEELRMAAGNFAFKKYLFSKSTRAALGDNNPYLGNLESSAEGQLSLAGKAFLTTKKVLTPIWDGFLSNYLDDVTVGYGKGFGLGEYNNYLANKYNPEKAISTGTDWISQFISGLEYASEGAKEASKNGLSFYDGFVGALGSLTSFSPRFTAKERLEAMETMGLKLGDNLTFSLKFNKWVMNPLINNYYEALSELSQGLAFIDKANSIIASKGQTLLDITEIISALNSVEASTGINKTRLEAKNAKALLALQLVTLLDNWSKDAMLSLSSLVLNAQATLENYALGNIDENTIALFLSLSSNKSIADLPNAREVAVLTILNNALLMLKMQETVKEVSKTINDSKLGKRLTRDQKALLTYQLAMNDNWLQRVSEMELEITGNSEINTNYNADAEYGSRKSWERKKAALEKAILDIDSQINSLQDQLSKAKEKQNTSRRSRRNLYTPKIQSLELLIKAAQERKLESIELLEQINTDELLFIDDTGNKTNFSLRVLTEQEILSLSPKQRAWMLNKNNLSDYSAQLQKIIKQTIANLQQKNPDILETINDVNELNEMVVANNKAYEKLVDENNAPAAATYALQLLESRILAINRIWKAKALLLTDDIMNKAYREDKKNGTTSEMSFVKLAARSLSYEALIDYINRNINTWLVEPDGTRTPVPESHPLYNIALVLKILSDAANAINTIFNDNTQAGTRVALSLSVLSFTENSNNAKEAMSSLENAIDAQTNAVAKSLLEAVLNKMQELGHLRDATKVVNRLELARKKAEEEAAKVGDNYRWNGYKVGDTVYDRQRGKGTVTEFFQYPNGSKTGMTVKFDTPFDKGDGTMIDVQSFNSKFDLDRISKTEVKPTETPDLGKTPTDKSNILEIAEEPTNVATDETVTVESEETKETLELPTGEGAELRSVSEEIPIVNTPNGDLAISPSLEQQASNLLGIEVIMLPSLDLTELGNRYDNNSPDLLAGNFMIGLQYDALELNNTGKLVRVESETAKLRKTNSDVLADRMEVFLNWLDKNKIRLLDIIDNELGRIILKYPDTKIRFLTFRTSERNLFKEAIFPVIEYTKEIAKFHDEANGGVLTANGKLYLIVGVEWFTNAAQREALVLMNRPLLTAKNEYFKTNPKENYYVHPTFYTNFHSGTTGYVVRLLEGQEEVRIRKVSELANGKKSNSNPEGLSIEELKWGILKADRFVTVGVSDRNIVLPPKDRLGSSGNVFMLVRAANGNYIPIHIRATMYNELVEGSQLKTKIDTLINDLTSPVYEERVTAIKELVQFLNLDESDNILIGDKNHLTISIKQNGNITRTFNLDANFNRAEFLNAINNSHFRVNITTSTLLNPTAIKMYDEAGALTTDVAKLGTSNMVYSVYPCDSSGKPIVTENAQWSTLPNRITNGDLSRKLTHSTIVNGKTYRERDGVYYDVTDKVIDKESSLGELIYWNLYILTNQLEPATRDKGFEYYIIRNDINNPLVVKKDSRNNITVADTETSRKTIETINNRLANEARANAALVLVEVLSAEELARINLQMDNMIPLADLELLGQLMLTDELLAQLMTGNFTDVISETGETIILELPLLQQEKPLPLPKKDVNEVGNNLVSGLNLSEKITTFASAYKNNTYRNEIKSIFEAKGWSWKGSMALKEKFLKDKGISTVGISDIDSWLQMIKDCK